MFLLSVTSYVSLHWQELGLSFGASDREIGSAYRKLTLLHHPDKPGGNGPLFEKISRAYEVS